MAQSVYLRNVILMVGAVNVVSAYIYGQTSHEPVPAIPAAPSKYDFEWENYSVRSAQKGEAFYIFEGTRAVGIATISGKRQIELFPLVFGADEQKLRSSFSRYEKVTRAATASLNRSGHVPVRPAPPRSEKGSGTTDVVFNNSTITVSMNDGTKAKFANGSIEVTLPSSTPGIPGDTIAILPETTGAMTDTSHQRVVLINGHRLGYPRSGPVWQGLKELVLTPVLDKASQAAHLARGAGSRPENALDLVALVAKVETSFGITPISFF